MKIKNEKLTVKLDVELSAEQITNLFCNHYYPVQDAQGIANVALRLNKTEVLKLIKDVMRTNITSSINHEHDIWITEEMFDTVLPIMRRKFDGIS